MWAKMDATACHLHLPLLPVRIGSGRPNLMAENTHCFLFHCLLYFNLSFMCICREKPLSHPCLRLDIPSILLPPSLRDTTLNLPFHPPTSLHILLVNILRFLFFFFFFTIWNDSLDITVRVVYVQACSTLGWNIVYKIFIGKHEVRRLLGRPRCRWEDCDWLLWTR
jgi:hypothetical protein